MPAISRCGSAAVTRQNNARRSWPMTATGKRVDVRADCGGGARPGSELVLTSRTQPPFVF